MTGPDSNSKTAGAVSRKRTAAQTGELRELTAAMLAKGNGEKAVDVLLGVVEALQRDNERLTYRLTIAARARFGRRSEKLNAEELGQLVLALGGTEQQAGETDPLVPIPRAPTEQGSPVPQEQAEPKATGKKKKRRPNHPGRTQLAPDLPRKVTLVPVPDEERRCVHCGAEMICIGHLDHETVEFIPARIEVHVERREKLACRACKQDIVTAPRDQSVPYQRRAGMSLLANLVESKCDDALPVYRQQDQLRRLGFTVPLSSLYGYWDYATTLLQPVADVIVSTVLGDAIVGVDDTKLDYLDPGDPRGRQRGHLWCFVGCGTLVGFVFTESWCAEEIEPWLSAIDGFIQCDDYKGYGTIWVDADGTRRVLVPPERRLGCMMHVRRRLHRAYLGRHLGAALPLQLIKDLYAIEARAKEAGLGPSERLALRQRESRPLLTELDAWVDESLPKLLPSSPLASACKYAQDQRPYIERCFGDGRFEIDNGRVERDPRACGRSQEFSVCWLGRGSRATGGRVHRRAIRQAHRRPRARLPRRHPRPSRPWLARPEAHRVAPGRVGAGARQHRAP